VFAVTLRAVHRRCFAGVQNIGKSKSVWLPGNHRSHEAKQVRGWHGARLTEVNITPVESKSRHLKSSARSKPRINRRVQIPIA
jgi:hypothetical protein